MVRILVFPDVTYNVEDVGRGQLTTPKEIKYNVFAVKRLPGRGEQRILLASFPSFDQAQEYATIVLTQGG